MSINDIPFGNGTIFSAELISELEKVLKKENCKYRPEDLQEIGLDIAKFVFMKEVVYGKV